MRELVVIDKLNMGGVTSALLNYLEYSTRFYVIDLLVFGNVDDESLLPSNVNVLKAPKVLSLLGYSQKEVVEKSKVWAFFRGLMAASSKILGGHYVRKFIFLFTRNIGDYDVAISYTHDVSWNALTTGCNDYVLNKVRSKYKQAFVHCDFKLFGGYDSRIGHIYDKFNSIVCVSNGCRNSFIECFPYLKSKTVVGENFINIQKVYSASEPAVPYRDRKYKLVTVCRVEEQKGIFRIVDVAKKLKNEGYDFIWRIVGDGPDFQKIMEMVKGADLDDVIEFSGRQNPPYRYIKGASFFVLPSYHEAAPMVFGECRVLGVPILSTRTTSAEELLTERGLGCVCDNNTDALYESVKKIMDGIISFQGIDNTKIETTNEQAEKEFRAIYSIIKNKLKGDKS